MKLVEQAHPLGFGEPRDVASAIAFLLSPARALDHRHHPGGGRRLLGPVEEAAYDRGNPSH